MSSRHVAAEAVAAEAVEAPVDTWAHVPEANRVADLETILQERDACGVSTPLGNPQSEGQRSGRAGRRMQRIGWGAKAAAAPLRALRAARFAAAACVPLGVVDLLVHLPQHPSYLIITKTGRLHRQPQGHQEPHDRQPGAWRCKSATRRCGRVVAVVQGAPAQRRRARERRQHRSSSGHSRRVWITPL